MTTTLHFTPTAKSRVMKDKNSGKILINGNQLISSTFYNPVSVILTSEAVVKDGDTLYDASMGIIFPAKNPKENTVSTIVVAAYPPIDNIPTISESDLPYLIEMGNAGCFEVEVETMPIKHKEFYPNGVFTGVNQIMEEIKLIEGCVLISRKAKAIKSGIELIAEERKRQIEVEGYDVNNDSENYDGGQLVGAAMCYAANSVNKMHNEDVLRAQISDHPDHDEWQDAWPWDSKYDKREKHDQQRSLVIAGALIAAELDRLNNL